MGNWLFSTHEDAHDAIEQHLLPELRDVVLTYVELKETLKFEYASFALVWLDSNELLSTSYSTTRTSQPFGNSLDLWVLPKRKMVWDVKQPLGLSAHPIVLDSDNGLWVSATEETISIWNEESELRLEIPNRGTKLLAAMEKSRIVAVNQDNLVRVFDTDGFCLTEFQDEDVTAVTTSKELIVTGNEDGWVGVWRDGEYLKGFPAHSAKITTLCIAMNLLVSGSTDCTVKVWSNSECVRVFLGHTAPVLKVVPFKKGAASCSEDTTVRVWDFQTCGCQTLRAHKYPVHALASYGPKLASATMYSIRIWQ